MRSLHGMYDVYGHLCSSSHEPHVEPHGDVYVYMCKPSFALSTDNSWLK